MTPPGYVRLYPVAEGRCPCCGRQKPVWDPGAIIQAIKDWYGEHGNAPSKRDWQHAGHGHPAYQTVYEVFGSLERARSHAGLKRRYVGVTHCKRGHEFTPANTYLHPQTGARLCRQCRAADTRRYRLEAAAR